MNLRPLSLTLLMVSLLSTAVAPGLGAQEYGKLRPLNQRALQVVQQRDAFITQVLNTYGIAHQRDPQGAVVRIQVDNRWLDVTTIEIVPVVAELAGQQQVTAHELIFTTSGGVLELRSELKIR